MRGKDFEANQAATGRKASLRIKKSFGPYINGPILKEGLKIIRKIFPYRDQRCEPGQGRPCFNRQIGLCPGVCTGEISATDYAKTIRNITYFFEGKKGVLLAALTRDMNAHAKKQEFERANEIKRTLFALEHIQDITLIRDEEMYSAEENSNGSKNTHNKLSDTITRYYNTIANL